jgi:hypothetical protein
LLDLMFIGPEAYCFTMGRGVGHIEQLLEILASVQPCQEKKFDVLEALAQRHIQRLSGVLCVLLAWDEPRQNLVKMLVSQRVPLKVFVVTSGETRLNPGPMSRNPADFHVLPVGKVAERLAAL